MNIAWLRPALLWGLAVLAVPVLLHLLNRRRTLRLDFPTLRFFEATAVAANRTRTVKRILQLLARMGIVACIVLLFAGPHDPRNPFAVFTDPQTVIYAWIDPTVSMQYREEGMDRGEYARALLDTLHQRLAPSAVVLSWNEAQKKFTAPGAGIAGESTRHGPARFDEAVYGLFEHLKAHPGPAVAIVFSDMQAPSTAVIDSALGAWPASCPVLLVDMGPERLENCGITRAQVSAENSALLEVQVRRQGGRPLPGHVQVVLDGILAGRGEIAVRDADSARVFIELPRQASAPWGTVWLGEHDGLALDDSMPFLRRQAGPRSVVVAGQGKAVYPIVAALQASGRDHWERVAVMAPQEITAEDIEAASLLVLDQLISPPAVLGAMLTAHSRQGTAVLFAASTAPAAQGFNALVLRRFSDRVPEVVDDSAAPVSPVLSDTLSPLWRGFPRRAEREASVYRHLRGLPGEALVRLDNGDVLASRVSDSTGLVWVLLATPLGICEDNNLCETGFYVPLLDRLARYAAASASTAGERWYAGSAYRNPYFGRHGGVDVFDARGEPVSRWVTQPRVELERPGIYRLAPDNEQDSWLLVAADPQELDLRYQKPSTGKTGHVAIITARGFAGFVERAGESRLAAALWIALGALVLAEMLLWRFKS